MSNPAFPRHMFLTRGIYTFCTFSYTHAHTRTDTHRDAHTYTQIYIHMPTEIHMHTHMYTHVHRLYKSRIITFMLFVACFSYLTVFSCD